VYSHSYHAERDASIELLTTLEPRARPRTLVADNGYDMAVFVEVIRACGSTPHVAQNAQARKHTSPIDGYTTQYAGDAISQHTRKLVEASMRWAKTVGELRKPRHRWQEKIA
jgi:hypothetical protein